MIFAVFCRPDHPEGYGQGKRAHGYSTIIVACSDEPQVAAVQQRLATEGLPEPLGHGYPWYGGRMDLVARLYGPNIAVFAGGSWVESQQRFWETERTGVSLGDNRFVGFYDARDLLP